MWNFKRKQKPRVLFSPLIWRIENPKVKPDFKYFYSIYGALEFIDMTKLGLWKATPQEMKTYVETGDEVYRLALRIKYFFRRYP